MMKNIGMFHLDLKLDQLSIEKIAWKKDKKDRNNYISVNLFSIMSKIYFEAILSKALMSISVKYF